MRAAVGVLLVVFCFLALSDAWRCRRDLRLRNAQQIDAGQGNVVAVDRYRRAYFRSGTSWCRLGRHSLKHVTVGAAGLWGVDARNRAYKFVAGNFRYARTLTMTQVDAGGDGHLVGASSSYYPYCMREHTNLNFYGVGTVGWTRVSSLRIKYYSCGPSLGCWGVDTRSRVYVARVMNPNNCGTVGWTHVSGIGMQMIEVATDGNVFGVATNGRVYQRTGISTFRRQGTGWTLIPTPLSVRHLSYDLRNLWVVTTSGLLYQCSH